MIDHMVDHLEMFATKYYTTVGSFLDAMIYKSKIVIILQMVFISYIYIYIYTHTHTHTHTHFAGIQVSFQVQKKPETKYLPLFA